MAEGNAKTFADIYCSAEEMTALLHETGKPNDDGTLRVLNFALGTGRLLRDENGHYPMWVLIKLAELRGISLDRPERVQIR